MNKLLRIRNNTFKKKTKLKPPPKEKSQKEIELKKAFHPKKYNCLFQQLNGNYQKKKK
jgi:hypothetical protein